MTEQPVFEKTFDFTNGYTIEFSDLGDCGLLVKLTDNNGGEDSASIIIPTEEMNKLKTWLANLITKEPMKRNVFRTQRAHHYEGKKGL